MSSGIATLCPAWSIPGYLEVQDDHLTVNGADTIELVEEFGSPLFVFSDGRICDNIRRLQLRDDLADKLRGFLRVFLIELVQEIQQFK